MHGQEPGVTSICLIAVKQTLTADVYRVERTRSVRRRPDRLLAANCGRSICQKACSKAAVQRRLENVRVKNVIHELRRTQRMFEYIGLVSHLGKGEWMKHKRSANNFARISPRNTTRSGHRCARPG